MIEQIKGYTVFPDVEVERALNTMVQWWEKVILWLVFTWEKFQLKIMDSYVQSLIEEKLWKKTSEQ